MCNNPRASHAHTLMCRYNYIHPSTHAHPLYSANMTHMLYTHVQQHLSRVYAVDTRLVDVDHRPVIGAPGRLLRVTCNGTTHIDQPNDILVTRMVQLVHGDRDTMAYTHRMYTMGWSCPIAVDSKRTSTPAVGHTIVRYMCD